MGRGGNSNSTTNIPPVPEEQKEGPVDYESAEQQAKFNTRAMGMPDSLSYYDEVKKAFWGDSVNYAALDSLFATGVDINQTLYYESRGGFGLGFKFSLRGGFQRTYGSGLPRGQETTAIAVALDAFSHSVIFTSAFDTYAVQRSFDLVHFLLSRGVDPNAEGLAPLFKEISMMASHFDRDESHLPQLIELYKFYGFDMAHLDLSACNNEFEVLHFLIKEGARTYNMNSFSFEPQVRYVYTRKKELKDQGVIFDFTEVDGHTFPFETDTTCLRMFLEMGLSPNHVTPEGKKLRNDFGPFSGESLRRVLDQYVAEQEATNASL
ncbi:MAG TPA: hypothetical protein DCE41_08095 [Cytophagales bacterium]|nr:hypothetical protein [Cytophagales bacterium]